MAEDRIPIGRGPRGGITDSLLQGAVATMPGLSILVFDPELRIHAVQGDATRRHGYFAERMIGRAVPDVVPAAAWERLEPLYTRALTGETVTVELPSHDGAAVYETTFSPIHRDGQVVGGLACSRDITRQREAEDALRRSERDFRLLAESASDMITRSAPSGEVLYVSPSVRAVLGIEPQAFHGALIWDRTHPDDLPAVIAARRDVLADGRTRCVEYRARHGDGREVWLQSEIRAVRDADTGAVQEIHGATRDITQRRADDVTRQQWQLSFDRTTRGIVIVDPATLTMRTVNTAFARMHGGEPADFAGRALSTVFTAEAAAGIPAYADAIARDGYVRHETDHVRLDGSVFPVETEVVSARDDQGTELCRLGFLRDLTERRAREAATSRAVERFERSFTQAPVGMLILRAGRIERANTAIAELVGLTPEELVGRDPVDFVLPEDLPLARRSLADVARAVAPGAQDRRILGRDGNVLHMRLRYSILGDDGGDDPAVLVHFVDRTAEVHAAEQHEQARRELSEAKGRLQAILDHSPMAIYMRDLEQRWILTNPETCRIIGMAEEELRGRPMAETLSPELFEHLATHDAEVLATGQARSFDETAPDARTGHTHHWWSLKFPVRDDGGEVVGLGGVSLDVTERERVTRELVAAQSLFATMFDSASVGELVSRGHDDGSTEIIQCNPAFARMLGRTPQEIIGQSGAVVVHPDDLATRQLMMETTLAGRPTSGELRFKHRDGHDVWTLTSPAMTLGPDGERLFVIQAVDISERKHFEERLQHLADHDALTGLFGRRRFAEELAREVVRTSRYGGLSTLLLLDLDGFKYVNDSFGHPAGDELLTRMGRTIAGALREGDILARIGGDEFAVILPDTDVGGGLVVAAKLGDAIRREGNVTTPTRTAEVTASIGITEIGTVDGVDAEQLLVEADIAMYEAKDAGKDRVAIYDRAAGHREHHTDWIGRLRRAIADGRFILHAQPVVALQADADPAERYELLLRLQDEPGHLIAPDAFLGHAERHGLIGEIDRWVLGQAVGLLHDAHRADRDLHLAINLSARTMQDPGVARHLADLLRARPVRPGTLTIELTETTAITNVARAAELARQLRELGCRLALDDFGAGFASFAYLKHLVFDVLKIDGDFIERLPSSATDQLVVRAVVDVARGLGAEVVAEHVTDETTTRLLRELGVDFAQGFHLGRPAPLPDAGR